MTESPTRYPEGVLRALGHISVLWSNVETNAREALLAFSGATNKRAKKNMPIILAHMDLRDRLDALRAVCFLEMTSEDHAAADSWINHIINSLRPYRNRLVHDEWPELRGVYKSTPRVSVRSKLERQKGSGEVSLVLETHSYVIAEDLESFADDLRDAITALSLITGYKNVADFKGALPPLALRHTTPRQSLVGRQIQRKTKPPRKAPRRASRGK